MAAVPGVYFLDKIGARRAVGQGDLAQGVRLIVPQQLPVPPDSERDAGHGFMALPVVLEDFQARQSIILDGVLHAVPGDDGGGIGLGIPFPALRGGQLNNLISSGFQLREGIGTAGGRLAGVDGAALDVLDLDPGPGQAGAGCRIHLDHTQIAVGFIFKIHFGHLTIADGDLLDRLLAQQMVLRGHPLIDGVITHLGEGDGDGSGLWRGVDADGVAVRAHHLEGGAGEGDSSARLILGDLQGGVLRIGIGFIRLRRV